MKQSTKVIIAILDVLVMPIFLLILNNYLSSNYAENLKNADKVKNQKVTLIASPNSNTYLDNDNNQNSFNTNNTTINHSASENFANSYSIIGVNNNNLVSDLINRCKIIIENSSTNKIIFYNSSELQIYGAEPNKMYRSPKGYLMINVNGCLLNFKELEISSFGPAPKSTIETSIQQEIDLLVEKNGNYIVQKIYSCVK